MKYTVLKASAMGCFLELVLVNFKVRCNPGCNTKCEKNYERVFMPPISAKNLENGSRAQFLHMVGTMLALKAGRSLRLVRPGLHRTLSAHVAQTPIRDERFATLTDRDMVQFSSILDSTSIVTDDADLVAYNTDWMGRYHGHSKVVLKPRTTEQVAQVMAYCNERCIAVVPQGGNTGMVGGSVPVHDEVILSMSAMNNILSFDNADGVAMVEAGVVLEKLDDHVHPHGYRVPLNLGAKGSCQIGGNLATNAGGSRMVRDGPLRAAVLGMEAVLPDGRILNALTACRKDNTGYDVKQLFIGAEGTLGIITRASIACVPRATQAHTVALAVERFECVPKLLSAAKKHLGNSLAAFEYMDANSIRITQQLDHIASASIPVDHQVGTCWLLIEATNEEYMENFVEHALECGDAVDGVVAENETQANALWELRESMSEGIMRAGTGGVLKYDISLPIAKFEDCVTKTAERARNAAVIGETHVIGFGHIGDGNLHLNVGIGERKDTENVRAALEPWVYEYVQLQKGSISAEHGLGLMKAYAIGYSKSDVAVDLMRTIKNAVDPNGICNPYKVLT